MSSSIRPPKPLDQVYGALRRARNAIRAEEARVGWARRFIHRHTMRHPHDEENTDKRGLRRTVTGRLAGS